VRQWLEAPAAWVPAPGPDHAGVLLRLVSDGHHIHDFPEVVRITGEEGYGMGQSDSGDLQIDDAAAGPPPNRAADSGLDPAVGASCRTVELQDFEGGFDLLQA